MRRRVAVVGAGQTRFAARRADATFWELAHDAVKAAMQDAGLEHLGGVDSCVVGMFNDLLSRQISPGDYVIDYIGMAPKSGFRVESGGATGAVAVRAGIAEVASGLADVTLVVGAEKATDIDGTDELLKVIQYIQCNTFIHPLGIAGHGNFALEIIPHMEKYGTTQEQMAMIAVKNRRNALNNPYAQGARAITVDDVLKSRMVTYPYKKLDCCLYSEGAAAVILAAEDVVPRFSKKPVWFTGVGLGTDLVRQGERGLPFPTSYLAQTTAARQAYVMAGITDPVKQLDVAELHDAFSGTELMSYEDLGFCGPGQGGRFIEEGRSLMTGDLPVNPSGGLMGLGHPVGATGIWQVGEITRQIRGDAGGRQVDGAKRGLVQNMGGPAMSVCAVFVLEG